jgi:DNA-binding transcriptional LysR family regulator
VKPQGLTLDDLAVFVDVVESGGITASARRLDTSKSVVSTRIASLEADLTASLFHRSSSKLVLTAKGEALYERAKQLLADVRRLGEDIAESKDELRGTLRIAAPTSFTVMYLSQLFARFMAEHPHVNLVIDLDDRQADIAGGGYDLGIRIGHMVDTALIGRRICSVRRVLCASPAYEEAHGLPERVDDLVRHVCVTYGNIVSAAHWSFESDGEETTPFHGSYRLVANNAEVQREAAIQGIGLILVPSFAVVDALLSGALRVVRLDREPVSLECFALYPRQRHPPRALRELINFLADEIGDPPKWERQLSDLLGYKG